MKFEIEGKSDDPQANRMAHDIYLFRKAQMWETARSIVSALFLAFCIPLIALVWMFAIRYVLDR